jgi:hypothetical protein
MVSFLAKIADWKWRYGANELVAIHAFCTYPNFGHFEATFSRIIQYQQI